jgi:hypothetical protein
LDQNHQLVKHSLFFLVDQNAFEEVSQESSEADKNVTAEQPSPVSVLDAAFYKEDPPSPVKKQSSVSKYLGKQLLY